MAQRGETEMPFLDHLEELRWRLVWAAGALLAGIAVAFVLVIQFDVVELLMRPIAPLLGGRKLVYTSPGDPLRIVMQLSFALGMILALPVLLYHLWAFVSPALYQHEKRVVIPVLVGAAVLFLAGVSLAFFIVLPVTLGFLLHFQTAALDPMITAAEYFSFAVGMAVAFGAVFELPIAIMALTALGLVTPPMLYRLRRHAIVAAVVLAAIITPGGDPFSLAALALPLYVLYEGSIGLSVLIDRRRTRREKLAAAEARA